MVAVPAKPAPPQSADSRPRVQRFGFTLVELMVTLAVASILIVASVPAFISTINGNRLTSIANELAASIQGARMESLRRGQRVVVCRSADGASCSAGNPWSGWIVFVDANGNGGVDAGETILRWDAVSQPVELWVSPAISGANHRIVFRADGLAYTGAGTTLLQANLSPCIKSTRPPENARDVGIVSGARVAVTRRESSGNCTAPANP